MLDLLDFMGWHLSTKNYKWVMAYGTLLGAFRNQTLLPCEFKTAASWLATLLASARMPLCTL